MTSVSRPTARDAFVYPWSHRIAACTIGTLHCSTGALAAPHSSSFNSAGVNRVRHRGLHRVENPRKKALAGTSAAV